MTVIIKEFNQQKKDYLTNEELTKHLLRGIRRMFTVVTKIDNNRLSSKID